MTEPTELYGLDNLPYGSFLDDSGEPRAAVRIGDMALDLTGAWPDLLPPLARLFHRGTLDALLAAGPKAWAGVRQALQHALASSVEAPRLSPWMRPVAELTMALPFAVADYVDFYASEHHATNVGRMFRPDGDPLLPNWRHLPVGYHGRAGTVMVSGTPIRRPNGQYRDADGSVVFGATRRLDFEAELGFVIGQGSATGEPIPLADFDGHVFGVCLLNDWSARDIQAWETAPLGPFLGKSFGTSISAWVTPLAALDAARVGPVARPVVPLPYLDDAGRHDGFDISLQVQLNGEVISQPDFAGMYWSPAQMLAHMTVNGASSRTGDLFGSGTVSGPTSDMLGCLLELTLNGTRPITLPDGSVRAFLEDGDEVCIIATAPGVAGGRIGLGEVTGRIEPA